MGHNYSLFTCN